MLAMSWPEVRRRRLECNGLAAPVAPAELPELVGRIGRVQAQVLAAAELAIGARTRDLSRAALHRQLWSDRTLVKTYAARGTLHLLPAAELPLWLAAARARLNAADDPWRQYQVRPDQGAAIVAAIGAALDGRCLTRDELAAEVVGKVGRWAEEQLRSAWGFLLSPAAYAGLLCYGPSVGAKVTFVRTDQWVRDWWTPSEQDGLRHALRRYVGAFGPVVPADFARWWGLQPAHAKALFADLGAELVEVDVAGRVGYLLADQPTNVDSSVGSVRLLPQYDSYVIGSHPRDRILPEAARKRVSGYRRGRFEGVVALNVLLVDGVVAGIWERRRRGRRTDIQVEPFVDLTTAQRDRVHEEAAAIGAFLDSDVTVAIGRLD